MCNYQGYEFGASYPDSMCMDGQLYDADACDGHGNVYEPMEYIPCPMCHPIAYIKSRADYFGGGYEWYVYLAAFFRATILTLDIWKNRILGTEPWKRK